MTKGRGPTLLAVAALAAAVTARAGVASATPCPAGLVAAVISSDGPVVPLPNAVTEPEPAAPQPASASGVASPPTSALRAPAPPPSLLDPFPGTPGGPPLPPSPVVEEARPLLYRASLHLAASARAGEGPKNLPPRWGFAIGANLARRLATLGSRLSLWGTADFFYSRFSHSGSLVQDGASGPESVSTNSLLSQSSFVFLPVLSVDLGRLSPWLGGGVGFSLGALQRETDGEAYSNVTAHELVARAAAGLDYAWQRNLSFGVRVAFSSAIWPSEPRVVPQGASLPTSRTVFGPWSEAGLGVHYRF